MPSQSSVPYRPGAGAYRAIVYPILCMYGCILVFVIVPVISIFIGIAGYSFAMAGFLYAHGVGWIANAGIRYAMFGLMIANGLLTIMGLPHIIANVFIKLALKYAFNNCDKCEGNYNKCKIFYFLLASVIVLRDMVNFTGFIMYIAYGANNGFNDYITAYVSVMLAGIFLDICGNVSVLIATKKSEGADSDFVY